MIHIVTFASWFRVTGKYFVPLSFLDTNLLLNVLSLFFKFEADYVIRQKLAKGHYCRSQKALLWGTTLQPLKAANGDQFDDKIEEEVGTWER